MTQKFFRVGETVTVQFAIQAGTQYCYFLAHLTGGAVLTEEIVENAQQPGGEAVQVFTFKFLQPGKVEIQIARYHTDEEVIYEDMLTYEVAIETELPQENSPEIYMGAKIRQKDGTGIFFLQYDSNGPGMKRMLIPNVETCLRVFNSMSPIVVSPFLMDAIPEMEMMNSSNAGLYKDKNTGAVFFCTGKKRYWVPSYEILDAVDFNRRNMIYMCEHNIYAKFPEYVGKIICEK